jgi:hypothetical protein
MRLFRTAIILVIAATILVGVSSAVWSETSSGQVVVVQDWTLYIRTALNKPLSFNPYWVYTGGSWVPVGPGKNYLPALESGEQVTVNWTMDTEGRRRINSIAINSALTGTTKGVVVYTSATQLTIRPKDEPGTVTLHTKWIQIEGRWVPDPEISRKLLALTRGNRVTVGWAWDPEGRKRITGLTTGW